MASFVALFVALSIASDVFLTWTNLINILDQWAPSGSWLVLRRWSSSQAWFDLSVGAIFAVAGITAAKVVERDVA